MPKLKEVTMSTQAYPVKPVRLLVPFPTGGSTEFTALRLGEKLTSILGQPFFVEIKVGEFGITAMRTLLDADTHTLMVGSVNTNSIAPVVFRKRMNFDYVSRIKPVSRLAEIPSLLVTRSAVPANTVSEFIDYAKHTWGRIRNGTDWIGTYPDIDGIIFARAGGFEIVNIPKSGGADGLLAALIADEMDMVFLNARTAGNAIRAGKLKALAVTGLSRLKTFPEVPTMAEAGFPGIGTAHWHGLFASDKVPEEIVRLLHRSVVQAFGAEEVRAALENTSARVSLSASPEQFAAEIAAEMAQWEKVVADINLDVE
jgi:tripartite-type tricarboxylate transporter receptor subunit TctC